MDEIRPKTLSPFDELRIYLREGARYAASKLRRESYLAYQVRRYDQLWAHNPGHFSSSDRTFQLTYCHAHGLTPDMLFLDFGCGPLAAGLHFINYLDPGNYIGADISEAALTWGRQAIEAAGLAAKKPCLVHLPVSGAFDPLLAYRFDFIWAQSVVTHMAPENVASLMQALKTILAPQGNFFASFYLTPHKTRREGFKDYSYTAEALRQLAHQAGLACAICDDFNHPRPIVHRGQRMTVMHLAHLD